MNQAYSEVVSRVQRSQELSQRNSWRDILEWDYTTAVNNLSQTEVIAAGF